MATPALLRMRILDSKSGCANLWSQEPPIGSEESSVPIPGAPLCCPILFAHLSLHQLLCITFAGTPGKRKQNTHHLKASGIQCCQGLKAGRPEGHSGLQGPMDRAAAALTSV